MNTNFIFIQKYLDIYSSSVFYKIYLKLVLTINASKYYINHHPAILVIIDHYNSPARVSRINIYFTFPQTNEFKAKASHLLLPSKKYLILY